MDQLNTWQKYYCLEMAFYISQNISKHLAGLDWLRSSYHDRTNCRNFKTSSFLLWLVLIAFTRTVFFLINSSTETIVRAYLASVFLSYFFFFELGVWIFLFIEQYTTVYETSNQKKFYKLITIIYKNLCA